jgi:hypothetical protein
MGEVDPQGVNWEVRRFKKQSSGTRLVAKVKKRFCDLFEQLTYPYAQIAVRTANREASLH